MRLVCALLLSLSGCVALSGYDATLNSYLGRSSTLLFERWGQPSQAFQASSSTFVVTYRQRQIVSYPGAPSAFDPATQLFLRTNQREDDDPNNWGMTKPGASLAWCDTVFTITNGIVTNWSYEGNSCG